MKKSAVIALIALLILAAAVAYWLLAGPADEPSREAGSPAASSEDAVVATNGVHTHAVVEVYIQGAKQPVPGNIGIGPGYSGRPSYNPSMQMAGMHTHGTDGVVHLEYPGTVRVSDLTLGRFFDIWGRSFDEFGSKAIVKVNGEEIADPMRYRVKDGDKIILSFFP